MRKLWIFVFTAIIVGTAALMEIYGSLEYPVVEYSPRGLPSLPVGVEYRYDFLKDGSRVGSYVFRVDRVGQFNGKTAYFTSSSTSVIYKNTTIDLETIYVFSDKLTPLDYRLNATLGSDYQTLVCLFDGKTVDTSMQAKNSSVRRKVDLPADAVLIDNNMIGQWDLFFKSFDPVPGTRISFTMFVPQALDKKSMEIIIDKELKTIKLNDVNYECQVIRGTEQNIAFYLYKGDLIRLEDSDQNITINMVL